jgi:MurNAc alpha-1-phosphate uridylyltransferase
VVNVHAFADRLEAHLKGRSDLEIVISDERDLLLETGGGLKTARTLLGDDPVWVCNIDSVWLEGSIPAMRALADAWDPERMDACLLLAPMAESMGFDGPGDFYRDEAGRLTHRGDRASAPFNYIGVQIRKPAIVDGGPEGPFSLMVSWRELMAQGRLHGVVMDGFWMHVGDPAARNAAEARLR